MSSETMMQFVERLRERGVIGKGAPAPGVDAAERPWFVSLLLGVAGWLAGIFLLLFVGFALDLDSSPGVLILGLVLLGAAWGIYVADRRLVFFDQLALALSIAGQFAIAWGVVGGKFSPLLLAVTLLALQLVVLFLMPNRIARTLAAFFATVAWTYVIRLLLEPAASKRLFYDVDPRDLQPPLGAFTPPVEWLLTWLPLLAFVIWLLRRETAWMASGSREIARPALTGLLLGLSIGGLVSAWWSPVDVVLGNPGALGIGFDWRALFPLLAIGISSFAAFGAFRLRSGGLLGFAVLAALLNLAQFYYLYGTTLLAKALIMACMGVALLVVGEVLRRRAEGRAHE